ncbi:MAG: M48 family metallopeptidase [Zoogloeaceae bacterium]|nr:M48 family metallopeptidase [Zoogloeaceae bacterium]MCK6384091.1 M48 family metallopeptidase [Rhodocyclaceae bacterium]
MLRLFQLELPLFRRTAPPAEQTRHILLGTRIVDYRLIRSSRRRLGMTIDQRGLRVGASPRTSLAEIERFLRHNAAWVLKKLDEWHGHGQVRHLAICDGARIPVLGEECVVRIEPGANRVRWGDRCLILQARPDADLRLLARRALRERALDVFREHAAHHAETLRRPLPRIALSNAQTRWGSCSEQTGIRLSWRLVHAPPRLIDYVVAHEMAHLVEMNHSTRFWMVVERLCPDYRSARDELRRLAATCPQI